MRPFLMESLAILDMDGKHQLRDTSARAEEAARRVAAHFAAENQPLPPVDSNDYRKEFYSRANFFNAEFLHLDQPNPHIATALANIRRTYADLYVVTSTPDFLAVPTMDWIAQHGIDIDEEEIRFKFYQEGDDRREQFSPTDAWKLTILLQMKRFYRRILFADDDAKNRAAIATLSLPNVTIVDGLQDFYDDGPIIL